MFKKILATALLFLAFKGFTWGHLQYFTTYPDYAQGHLIFDALFDNHIDYCLQIPDNSRFKGVDIDGEIKTALQMWLKPIEKQIDQEITTTQSQCQEQLFDLQITFIKSAHDGGSFHFSKKKSRHRAIEIRLYEGEHFSSLAALKDLSQEAFFKKQLHSTTDQYWEDRILYGEKAHWNIYRTLLHELGHAFGLCDTLTGSDGTCDINHRSASHESSIMKKASSYQLSPDDIAGIQSLINRFAP